MPLYRIGRIWYIDLPSHAGRIRRSTGTADKKEAQAFHDRIKGQLWRLEHLGERPPPTWGDAVQEWLKVERGEPDRYRVRKMEVDAGEFLPLRQETLDRVFSQIRSAGNHNRYRGLILAIHAAVKVDPLEIPYRKPPPGRTTFLRAEQWERLRKALKEESPLLEQIARFAISTGLRENNVLNLEWDRVDMARRTAFVEAPDVKQRVSLGLPLNDDAMAVLRERRGYHDRWVFAHPDSGKPLYKASMRAWYDALRKADLKGFRFHDLRHTWASWHAINGTRIEEIQKLGGWKTISMVQRYSHLSVEHLAHVAGQSKPVSMRYNPTQARQRNVKKGG